MPPSPTDRLQQFIALLSIAHHIPGRIRLKLDTPLAAVQKETLGEVQRLAKTFDTTPGIRAVNLNLLARSCTVEYDPACIAPTAWRDLIAGDGSPEAAALLARLITTPHLP